MSMGNGILRVTSGAFIVMKDTRKNNLYYFQGNTIIGIVAIVSNDNVN